MEIKVATFQHFWEIWVARTIQPSEPYSLSPKCANEDNKQAKVGDFTPETICPLNFDVEEQNEFSFLGSFSYTTGPLLSRSNGKS